MPEPIQPIDLDALYAPPPKDPPSRADFFIKLIGTCAFFAFLFSTIEPHVPAWLPLRSLYFFVISLCLIWIVAKPYRLYTYILAGTMLIFTICILLGSLGISIHFTHTHK